jgi:16S rRNA (guanine527-N7)-methyltransferase
MSGPALEGLTRYLGTLEQWSRRVNLTGARTARDRVRWLVEPVLAIQALPEAGTLVDVGSGNGSPGLVLALLRDDLEVTLLEPRTRRWAFLREAVRRTGCPRVEVLRSRYEDYGGPPARTVTLRALILPLAGLAPLVVPGGHLLVLGERPRLAGPFAEEAAPPGTRGTWLFRRLPASVPRGTLDA